MEKELEENLAELSKHIQGVGRMVGSKKLTLDKLVAMHQCLKDAAYTTDIYVKLIKENPDLLK